MVVYYIRGGELINFVACVDSDDWVSESWAQKADWEELRADFDGWHDDIVTLISAVDRDQCFPGSCTIARRGRTGAQNA